MPYISGNTGHSDKSNGGAVLEVQEYASNFRGYIRLPQVSVGGAAPSVTPPVGPKPSPRNLLLTSPWMSCPDVLAVQKLLDPAGGHLEHGSAFGPRTNQWLVDWQRKHQLEADGVIGPATWAALRKAGLKLP